MHRAAYEKTKVMKQLMECLKFKPWDGDIISVVIFCIVNLKQYYLPKAVILYERLKVVSSIPFLGRGKLLWWFICFIIQG